jgi:hypothetical protein
VAVPANAVPDAGGSWGGWCAAGVGRSATTTAAGASTTTAATSTTAASHRKGRCAGKRQRGRQSDRREFRGCHRRLNQADSRPCEHGYNRFPHRASLPFWSPTGMQHFRGGIIRRSNIFRGKLTVSRQSRLSRRPRKKKAAELPAASLMVPGVKPAGSLSHLV